MEKLKSYLESKEKKEIKQVPASLARHLEECGSCRKISQNPELARIFLNLDRNDNKFKKILDGAVPKDGSCSFLEGEVWRIVSGEDNEKSFAVITHSTFTAADGCKSAVRVVPVFFSPNQFDLDEKTDLVIEPEDFPTGITALLEWWNERPILVDHLEHFFGSIHEQILTKLKCLINEDPIAKNLSSSGKLFRQHRIACGQLLSSSFFKDLQTSEEKLSAQQEIFLDFQANENIALAASDIGGFHKKIRELVDKKSFPLNVLYFEDVGIKMICAKKASFVVEIKTSKEVKSFASDKNGVLLLEEKQLLKILKNGAQTISIRVN